METALILFMITLAILTIAMINGISGIRNKIAVPLGIFSLLALIGAVINLSFPILCIGLVTGAVAYPLYDDE